MFRIFREFINLETASGLVLMGATLLALLSANSFFYPQYQALLNTSLGFDYGGFSFSKPVLFWVNEGLMSIFFLVVGLEIKRESIEGHLSEIKQRVLPGLATVGGVLIPALIYTLINRQDPVALRGWAIPTATDIAFALSVLALVGSRIPVALKIFLMTVAILDDLSSVIVIAIFYAADLSLLGLSATAAILLLFALMNYIQVQRLLIYLILGFILWLAVLSSGIQATLAGILFAFTIPLRSGNSTDILTPTPLKTPLIKLERSLHPWVAYLILPIFAFTNAGIRIEGINGSDLFKPLPLGIILGLFLGKQLGVFGGAWLSIKLGWSKLPDEVTKTQLYGVSVLCGVGFTMSLFISALAFGNVGHDYENLAKIGILLGSLLSALLGFFILKYK